MERGPQGGEMLLLDIGTLFKVGLKKKVCLPFWPENLESR